MRTIIAAAAVLVLALLPLAAPWLQFVLTLAIAKGFAALGVAVLLRAGLISIGHAMFLPRAPMRSRSWRAPASTTLACS